MKSLKDRLEEVKAHFKIKTNEELAERVGLSRISIYRLFDENPSSKNIAIICASLGVNVDWLKKEEGPMINETKRDKKKSSDESDAFAAEAIAKIEERWKAENELLKERIKQQDLVIQSLSESLAKPSAKHQNPVFLNKKTMLSLRAA